MTTDISNSTEWIHTRRAVESEEEAFFLRITKQGDHLYEGADMGILVSRGRMMTPDFELTDRAKTWINAIRREYVTTIAVNNPIIPDLTGSLTK